MDQRIIDLRSDTVTQPTPDMRDVMANAVVGDDVLGNDPTVKQLESYTARLLGKEAALFVPSGTMANQIAVRCHTQPGEEILLDANAHIYWYEAGGSAALSGAMCRVLHGKRGVFSAAELQAALRPPDLHLPPSKLLAVENTHNRGGGTIWPLEQIVEVCNVARQAGLCTHLDGARLWNASVATGIAESKYAEPFDSVSVCFSKGLGAPVGSAIAGSEEFIARAMRVRKQFGGGMRQSGIIAAGALYALDHNRLRLADDHANAKRLAEGLCELSGVKMDIDAVETNIVYFDVEGYPVPQLVDSLKEKNVLVLQTGATTIRAVTSLEVDAEDIEQVIHAIRDITG